MEQIERYCDRCGNILLNRKKYELYISKPEFFCNAKTKRNERCKMFKLKNKDYCKRHNNQEEAIQFVQELIKNNNNSIEEIK